MRNLLALWVLLSLTAAALPSSVEQALRQPGPVEILSLSPLRGPLKPGPTSGGFSILGCAQLGPEERAQICAAVLKGLQEGEQENEKLASCFEPRHALRSGELEVVICYSCHRWNAYQQGVEIGSGRITQRGSRECERAIISHGLEWQGWAELDNQVFHATGFSIALAPELRAERRGKLEHLELTISKGTIVFHSTGKADHWLTGGGEFSLDSPLPVVELHERLRDLVPEMNGQVDAAANRLDVFLNDDDFLTAIVGLLSPEDAERMVFYPSRDSTIASNYLEGVKADLETRSRLTESSPGLWTGYSQNRFQAVALLEREGRYLVCRAEFKGDEASGRNRLDKLLSLVRFRGTHRVGIRAVLGRGELLGQSVSGGRYFKTPTQQNPA